MDSGEEEEELGFDPWRESTMALQDMIKMENEATSINQSADIYLKQQQQPRLDRTHSFNENLASKGSPAIVPIPPGFQIYNNGTNTNSIYSSNQHSVNQNYPSHHQPNGFSASSTSSSSPASHHTYPSIPNGKYYCRLKFFIHSSSFYQD